jgi:hypothetical protein
MTDRTDSPAVANAEHAAKVRQISLTPKEAARRSRRGELNCLTKPRGALSADSERLRTVSVPLSRP